MVQVRKVTTLINKGPQSYISTVKTVVMKIVLLLTEQFFICNIFLYFVLCVFRFQNKARY